MADAETQAEAPERSMAELASQHFGRNFHGEVPERTDPEGEGGSDEALREEQQEVDAEGQSEEAAESEDEAELIQSLSELVEAQEWDPEWVNSLRVPVKIDGEQTEVPFSDVVGSYQTQAAAEKRLEDAKAKAKAMREEAQQGKQAVEAQITVLGSLVQNAEQALDAEVASIDWASLRENDPAEFAAKKHELGERKGKIDEMKQQALRQWQQSLAQQQHQEKARKAELLQQEQQALLQALPSWSDPETAKAEQTKLVGYLTDQGFAQEDVMGASDHRLILLARKAMLYDHGQQAQDVAAKKVRKVPKTLKPGAPKSESQINQQKQRDLRRRVRKAKTPAAGVDAALELMKTRRK